MGEDRLSELPDSLISYILSLLGDIKEVIKRTCLVSKRWQFLWTKMSEIDMYYAEKDPDLVSDFVNYVGKVLEMCSVSNHLQKFAVDFWYEEYLASCLDNWVQIAVQRNVKDISLIIFGGDCYKLPQMLYSHSSLTSLSLRSCVISPNESVNWQSLKSLTIKDAELSDCIMKKILSGCPVLEVLRLRKYCYGFTCLNIFSPTFTKLEIKPRFSDVTIDISAPYARELKITYDYEWDFLDEIAQFRLRDITSLVRASLDFNEAVAPKIYVIELLQSLQYVKELDLRDGCIESLPELPGLNIKSTTLRCTTLNMAFERNFHGFIFILKSSPYLETLTIDGHFEEFEDLSDEEITELVESMDLVFNHLKTINITRFNGESMMILAQILLKGANVLQNMNLTYTCRNECCEELSNTVLALPKASPQAIVTVVKKMKKTLCVNCQ